MNLSIFRTPLVALALVALISGAAVAAETPARDPDGYTWEGYSGKLGPHRGLFFDVDDVALLEKLDGPAQDKWVEDYYDREKSMGKPERQKIYDAKRKAYNALTPEQQKDLRARVEKLRVSITDRRKLEWDAKLAAAKVNYAERERTYFASLKTSEKKVLMRYKELIKQGMKQNAALVEVTKEAAAGSPSIKRQGEKSDKTY
ncbi:MAG: hypothetical protein ACAH80_07760 [Alphaproteobacteria bacterium]